MKLLLLFPILSFAGLSLNSKSYEYDFVDEKKEIKVKKSKRIKNKSADELLKKLSKQDKQIQEILLSQSKRTIVRKQEDKLQALTRLRGILINSNIATNRKSAKILVKLLENEFFEDALVRCNALSFGKRVIGDCNLLVSKTDEYSIEAELWDLDGAEGIIADDFYDGSEKEFLTSSFSSFFEGVINASKDTFLTPFGRGQDISTKNTALSGLESIAKNANKKIKTSAQKNIQVALVNSGREVIIYFNRGVSL